MAVRVEANVPIFSTTAASGSDPSTATLCAQRENLLNRNYEVRWIVGASTGAIWRLEHALSTGLGSTGIREQTVVFTGSNLSSEFVTTHRAEEGDRFRVIPLSSFSGTFACKIQAEILE